jgi:hypothetical protein
LFQEVLSIMSCIQTMLSLYFQEMQYFVTHNV